MVETKRTHGWSMGMGAEKSELSPGSRQGLHMQGYLENSEDPGFHASVWERQFSLQHEACVGGAYHNSSGEMLVTLPGVWQGGGE